MALLPKKTWRKIKWIFLVIFLAHTSFFLIFLVQQFNSAGFPITNLPLKLALVLGTILLVAFVYITWLRQIKPIRKAAVFLREMFFILYITSFVYMLLGYIINPPITITQTVELLRGNGLHRDYISYNNMGQNIKLAAMAAEDQRFPDHDGFDVKAIKKALRYNEKYPKKQRGASTISQQAAKNIFLWQGGGFFRKGLEVYFTFTIESLWSKETILCRYLNIAEMGRGIFGVQAAAKIYFNKDAGELTKQEAAQIIACLPNPKKLSVKPMSNYVRARAQRIVAQMNNLASDPDVQDIIK